MQLVAKQFISASELLEDSFKLASKILASGFKPTFIVGIWRGGAPIGIAVQELFEFCGVSTNHIAIRTASYSAIDQQCREVEVHGLEYLVKHLKSSDQLLIVDDVHDSGLSIAEVIKQLQLACADNIPATIKIATPYFKPANIKSATRPDFYLYETDKWLVFPHEIQDLSRQELLQYKPELASIVESLSTYLPDNN
jgi:hypoxanthine phosphoribosyltransferase|tara:strand:- start:193 stop:780 length:588 start_codon:yes stop_codon:yes gene_type:complete